jgi:alkanesulfonate monooxygenase SsuD/methylene tetrahydromethanopterin reductase-like flavin-dependent oxidoreductase (luciferase family)
MTIFDDMAEKREKAAEGPDFAIAVWNITPAQWRAMGVFRSCAKSLRLLIGDRQEIADALAAWEKDGE